MVSSVTNSTWVEVDSKEFLFSLYWNLDGPNFPKRSIIIDTFRLSNSCLALTGNSIFPSRSNRKFHTNGGGLGLEKKIISSDGSGIWWSEGSKMYFSWYIQASFFPSRSHRKRKTWAGVLYWRISRFVLWFRILRSKISKTRCFHWFIYIFKLISNCKDKHDFFHQGLYRKLYSCHVRFVCEIIHSEFCNRLLIFWELRKKIMSLILTYLVIQIQYLRNNRFDFFRRGLCRTLRTCTGSSNWKIVHFDPCIGILVVRNVQ